MNIESKKDTVITNNEELRVFKKQFFERCSEIFHMLETNKAYFREKKDKSGNTISVEIFDSETGKLLFYDNLTTMNRLNSIFGKKEN